MIEMLSPPLKLSNLSNGKALKDFSDLNVEDIMKLKEADSLIKIK